MTLFEALLNQRKYYKTDRSYVFTVDKPSPTKAAVAGGVLGGAKGLLGAAAGKHVSEWGGKKLLAKAAATSPGTKAKILDTAGKAALKVGQFSTKSAGKFILGGVGAGVGIPVGAAIGHAMAKRKLKYADPYVEGILDKVKGKEIKRKDYKNLLKGQRAIGVSAHRLYPRSGGN